MAASLSVEQARRLRMRAQRLSGSRPATTYAALQHVTALQAQDTPAARLAIRPRSAALTAADVTRACNEERSVVRTWAMRGTLHMLPAEDVRWLVTLLGPIFSARDRGRRLELGLDADVCARALPLIRDILAGEHACTRGELAQALAGKGVVLDPKSQAPAHLVGYAAMQGVICRGAERDDDEPTYALLDEWVDRRLQQTLAADDALAELTRRYLRAYGPADITDFAAWAGIPMGMARRGQQLISDELAAVAIGGEPAWMLQQQDAQDANAHDQAPCVRLLAAFDAYLLGYRRRDFALSPRHARAIQAGGGWIHPTVVVDGAVVGSWRLLRARRAHDGLVMISVQPFEPLAPSLLPAIEAEAQDIGRFLHAPARLIVGQ